MADSRFFVHGTTWCPNTPMYPGVIRSHLRYEDCACVCRGWKVLKIIQSFVGGFRRLDKSDYWAEDKWLHNFGLSSVVCFRVSRYGQTYSKSIPLVSWLFTPIWAGTVDAQLSNSRRIFHFWLPKLITKPGILSFRRHTNKLLTRKSGNNYATSFTVQLQCGLVRTTLNTSVGLLGSILTGVSKETKGYFRKNSPLRKHQDICKREVTRFSGHHPRGWSSNERVHFPDFAS